MTTLKADLTRFERTITSIIGYQLIEGQEVEAVKIPIGYNINNEISITVTPEFLDDFIDLINGTL